MPIATAPYFITDVRNTARLPTYGRLDLRANRTFNWSRRRLTLFAEVINVLNRDNVRFTPHGINVTTRTATAPFDSMLPIVPSVGLADRVLKCRTRLRLITKVAKTRRHETDPVVVVFQ